MASKIKETYVCAECGAKSPLWRGQCLVCKAWNSLELVAAPVEGARKRPIGSLGSVKAMPLAHVEDHGCLIASLESRGDSAGRMEENALGQAATGIRETADELIAALRAVTNERIAEAAQSMTLDTVYFLTGEDSKDE